MALTGFIALVGLGLQQRGKERLKKGRRLQIQRQALEEGLRGDTGDRMGNLVTLMDKAISIETRMTTHEPICMEELRDL